MYISSCSTRPSPLDITVILDNKDLDKDNLSYKWETEVSITIWQTSNTPATPCLGYRLTFSSSQQAYTVYHILLDFILLHSDSTPTFSHTSLSIYTPT